MGLTIVTPASEAPISLDEVKALASVEDSSHDVRLNLLLDAAVRQVEELLGMALGPTVYRLTLDAWADAIELPRAPVTAVGSVKYSDTAGAEQTVSADDYTLDATSSPQWLVRNADATWPDLVDGVNAVRITFTAGFSDAGVPLPGPLKLAVGSLVSHWFDNGAEAGMPKGTWDLIGPWRRWVI